MYKNLVDQLYKLYVLIIALLDIAEGFSLSHPSSKIATKMSSLLSSPQISSEATEKA